RHNCAGWGGVVAIAINPASPRRDAIAAAWQAQFERVPSVRPDAYGKGIVDAGGILRVKLSWRKKGLPGIDFLLATPTEPNDPKVTTIRIARASKAGTYFTRTRAAGITTAGDAAILRALKKKGGARRGR
ncbi:MAG: hypothetical protein ACREF9_12355, partial [Opitutaceae bacterium]